MKSQEEESLSLYRNLTPFEGCLDLLVPFAFGVSVRVALRLLKVGIVLVFWWLGACFQRTSYSCSKQKTCLRAIKSISLKVSKLDPWAIKRDPWAICTLLLHIHIIVSNVFPARFVFEQVCCLRNVLEKTSILFGDGFEICTHCFIKKQDNLCTMCVIIHSFWFTLSSDLEVFWIGVKSNTLEFRTFQLDFVIYFFEGNVFVL